MPKVSLKDLRPGMKLDRPVTNESGMVLVGEGTELNAGLISRLENMHVSCVHVERIQQNARSREEMIAELDMRFSKSLDRPYMRTLRRVCGELMEEAQSRDGNTGAS